MLYHRQLDYHKHHDDLLLAFVMESTIHRRFPSQGPVRRTCGWFLVYPEMLLNTQGIYDVPTPCDVTVMVTISTRRPMNQRHLISSICNTKCKIEHLQERHIVLNKQYNVYIYFDFQCTRVKLGMMYTYAVSFKIWFIRPWRDLDFKVILHIIPYCMLAVMYGPVCIRGVCTNLSNLGWLWR